MKHAVSITAIGTEMLSKAKGQVVAKWPLHEVDLLQDGRRDNNLQLTNAHFPDARLTVEDPSLIRRLSTLLPKVFGKRLRRGHIWLHVAVTLAVVVATATVYYFAIPSLTKPCPPFPLSGNAHSAKVSWPRYLALKIRAPKRMVRAHWRDLRNA